MSKMIYESPVGPFRIRVEKGKLCELVPASREEKGSSGFDPDLEKVRKWLDLYFKGEETVLDLPLETEGTPFSWKVWEETCRIEYGKTRTYGEVSKALCGSCRKARAVGNALHGNRIMLVIPCHRVVRKDGPGGFAGGNELKKKLLEHESRIRI